MSDTRPLYKNDIANSIRSLYFAMKSSLQQRNMKQTDKDQQWLGALDAWSSVLLSAGINPEVVFSKDDIHFMAEMKKAK